MPVRKSYRRGYKKSYRSSYKSRGSVAAIPRPMPYGELKTCIETYVPFVEDAQLNSWITMWSGALSVDTINNRYIRA